MEVDERRKRELENQESELRRVGQQSSVHRMFFLGPWLGMRLICLGCVGVGPRLRSRDEMRKTHGKDSGKSRANDMPPFLIGTCVVN
jgi:hypothetical protein